MNQKELREIRRRFSLDKDSISHVYGCYVNAAKEIVLPGDYLPENLLDPKCKECVIRSVCPNCFGANYASTGSIYSRDSNICSPCS